jgi:hypothetical protein
MVLLAVSMITTFVVLKPWNVLGGQRGPNPHDNLLKTTPTDSWESEVSGKPQEGSLMKGILSQTLIAGLSY